MSASGWRTISGSARACWPTNAQLVERAVDDRREHGRAGHRSGRGARKAEPDQARAGMMKRAALWRSCTACWRRRAAPNAARPSAACVETADGCSGPLVASMRRAIRPATGFAARHALERDGAGLVWPALCTTPAASARFSTVRSDARLCAQQCSGWRKHGDRARGAVATCRRRSACARRSTGSPGSMNAFSHRGRRRRLTGSSSAGSSTVYADGAADRDHGRARDAGFQRL